MESCLYEGTVHHARHSPTRHAFRYGLFMVYVDLAELDTVFRGRWFWSATRPALARFRRTDHLGDPAQPLDEAVRDVVAARTGTRPTGPIRLLTHLRYFGFCFNPVSFYYCFDETERVRHVVAEVNNTPWGEQHIYVLEAAAEETEEESFRCAFAKAMHVSPFLPMDMQYQCRVGRPGEKLLVHMRNMRQGERVFDALLSLRRREFTGWSAFRSLVRFPFMTQQVVFNIYWQALRIYLKRIPFHAHP